MRIGKLVIGEEGTLRRVAFVKDLPMRFQMQLRFYNLKSKGLRKSWLEALQIGVIFIIYLQQAMSVPPQTLSTHRSIWAALRVFRHMTFPRELWQEGAQRGPRRDGGFFRHSPAGSF